MPNTQTETTTEITTEAIEILFREPGISKTLRFLGQLDNEANDYTKERENLQIDVTVADVVKEIKERRNR